MKLLLREGTPHLAPRSAPQHSRQPDLKQVNKSGKGFIGPTIRNIMSLNSADEMWFTSDRDAKAAAQLTRWPEIEPGCLKVIRHDTYKHIVIVWDETGDATFYRHSELQEEKQ